MITDCAGGRHTSGPGHWPLPAPLHPDPGHTYPRAPHPDPGHTYQRPHPHRARPAEAMIICFVIMGLLSFWPQ
jgi:hypothetical protein